MCRLRKAYYNARHEASAQIDEIVGETASEADSSETSVCDKDNGHEKDEDVIRCICGLYKDEGLMIQCEKCMVRAPRGSLISPAPLHSKWSFSPELPVCLVALIKSFYCLSTRGEILF